MYLHKIILFSIILLSFSFTFVHPKEIRAIQNKKLSQTILNTKQKDYTFLNLYGGSLNYPAYSHKDFNAGIEYGFVSNSPLCFRFGAGYGQNSSSSNILRSIPIYADVLLGYSTASNISAYIGAGINYTLLSESFSKTGIGTRFLVGLNIPSGPPFSQFFIEYNKTFLSLDMGNFDNEALKFGCAIFFSP